MLPKIFEPFTIGINDLKSGHRALQTGLDALNQKVNSMSHTLDEVLANEKAQTAALENMKVLFQAKVATVPGLTADQQTQIDEIFSAQTTNAAEIAAEVAALTPAPAAPATPAA
ncbi:MAG: hypothetical protein PHR16_16720 [Methylovulum sp.]|nr:hypothetical protein [Methylovulum sp.]